LPDEFLDCYRRGDFHHRIGDFSIDRIGDDPVFRAAVDANRGRYALSPEGSIIDARTGQPPDYVYAWPFPDIDPSDPQAAMKIVWNYFYTMYYGGNAHYRADLLWVSRRGLDRSIEVDSHVKYYDGQHPRFREPDADRELLTQSLAEVRAPADVNGVVSLSWRYRGADRRDSIWAFVPALRRVRQVSPANRSDGFLGSDLTQDDGGYFDGKVEDFTWKLVGEQDLLVLFDAPSFDRQATLERLPDGGWRMLIPGGARVGFQLPDWKGAPWCPVQEVLIKRPHWVVEAVPKDPYYLFGKLVFRFDKELFMGSYSSKYDWQGNLIGSYSAIRTNIVKVAPGELWGWAGGAVALALNWKLDRATTAGIVAGRNVPADSRIPLSPNLFSLQRLMDKGR
ncbi:MAG TPA: outer membrane lipoprotein-sorting protein, partial [Candidatus Dormibacteraeota bacterium]|nr:outer membrane lipoprotein-sorting protein [Candidatus Dormibacteraeota bacterium]